MLEVLKRWYQTRFSDPDAVTLFLLLVFCFAIIWLFGDLLAPLLVALVMAYLLEWPVARLQKAGLSRTLATSVILILFIAVAVASLLGLIPTLVSQGINLAKEAPAMLTHAQDYVRTLPDKYPELIDVSLVETVIDNIRQRILSGGEHLVSASLSSLVNVVAIMIYLILVPLMVFFHAQGQAGTDGQPAPLPAAQPHPGQPGVGRDEQPDHQLHPRQGDRDPHRRHRHLCPLRPDGTALLGAAGGRSRLLGADPLYRRRRGDGAGGHGRPVPVGAHPRVRLADGGYLVIQALDGNLLVPVLFSEAVNLHPVAIIIAVLVFGGLWGFWGVFFAIPLATLVKAVINAWPKREEMPGAAK